MRAAVAGDRTALSDLLRLTRTLAHRQALARTQDPEDSEWVYRITENEIGTLLRKRNSVAKVERLASLNLPAFALEPE